LIELWNVVLLEPMMNGLLVLSKVFGGSFGMAIIALTLIINILILPLTLRQIRSTKAMQAMQPKMKELQKKYAKDKQKLQQETFKLYREEGANPLGCALPLLIQMPIWIALYRSVMLSLATTPEHLFGLSNHLYSSSAVQTAVPAESKFLWFDLAAPNFLLVLLIMATMWMTQKMSANPSTDPKQQQMQSMMQWMMPLMFGFIFMSFPSGLALYIVVMNIFRMTTQRFVIGNWGGLGKMFAGGGLSETTAVKSKEVSPPPEKDNKQIKSVKKKTRPTTTGEEGAGDGISRSKRKNRRRGR